MGLFKFICKHFSCKSSCSYDPNEEVFSRESMSTPLSHYELKFKDIRKIMTVLNRRKRIKLSTHDIEI